MSNENAADKESIGNDRDAQTETVTLREYAELQQELHEVKEAVQDLKESKAKDLIDLQSDTKNPGLEDVWVAGQPLGKIIESNRKTAKSAEKLAREAGSSEDNPKGNDAENGSGNDLLPIERLLRGEDDDWYVNSATESVERAKELYRHFREWSSSTQKGRVIKTSGGKRGTATLKTLLNTALDGPDISWKQVYRACQKLEEWTKGAIQFTDHRRHGKMLVDGRASSAGSG